MTRNGFLCASVAGALAILVAAPAARAASLQQVSNWNGGMTFPSDVTMRVYVPDKLATNPPVLALSHYCGGSAQAVLDQARGIASAADQYGFIIVVPQNQDANDSSKGRCWDVTSTKTQKRDGGGDSHAIKQMVTFALEKYKGNANRVYATGDSSGGMMTELLLALYPDVFKAGSAFAGVPAGCGNEFDGSGLCGRPAQTAQQWGDRVRAMYSGYEGYRPRLQLFHGDSDATITYKNLAEAIKEWTNVLGLSMEPTSTDETLTLGTNHKATRQTWKSTSCNYVVLDVFTEHKDSSGGGDHGPSDTLFVAKYVLPFLGLDTMAAATAAVDPEVAQCAGDGGVPPGDAGADAGMGGGSAGGNGGRKGAGGAAGGQTGIGGSSTGGSNGSGGNATGGVIGSGGTSSSSGGTDGGQSTGGSATGGALGSGGTGGSSSTGGKTGNGNGTGGTSSSGGSAGNSVNGGSSSGGCSYAVGRPRLAMQEGLAVLGLGLALAVLGRRRRR